MSGGEPSSIKRIVLCAPASLYSRVIKRMRSCSFVIIFVKGEGIVAVYQALYRKYRSRNFDEVVGQEQVTVTLKNEIASGRIAHAFLFTGSRGTGKTSCSRIIAKAVNCPNQKDGNPCGVCDLCRGIDEGSVLDVVEIDAASNNGVDDIRQLREEATFTPSQAKYRVYIIDETHMLSTAAFNALLKILEEPPEHVIFILATTEVHKVPATILSRCQRFDFKRIKPAVIKEHLLDVAQQEGILLEEEAALLIARLADGGMRDALSLLDVCRSTANHISSDVVTQAAGLAMQDCLFDIGEAVLEQQLAKMLQVMETMHQASIDFEKMCVQLISHYRGLMMTKALRNPEDVVPNLPQDMERLKAQAAEYSMHQIIYCLTVLQDTLSRMNKTSQPRTELEMALIRMGSPEMDRSTEAIEARLDRLEKALASGAAFKAPKTSRGSKAMETASEEPAPSQQKEERSVENTELPSLEDIPKEQVQPFPQWAQVLEQLSNFNRPLCGALLDSKAYLYGELVLIDCESKFFLNLIRTDEQAKKSLHQAFQAATGRDYRIGPFQKDKYSVAKEEAKDPMAALLNQMEEAGLEIVSN